MAKVTDIKTKFQTVASSDTNIKSFGCGYLDEFNMSHDRQYPVLYLIEPGKSSIQDWSTPMEEYYIEFWIMQPHSLYPDKARTQIIEDLKDVAHDIIDAVDDRSSYFMNHSDVTFEFDRQFGNDKNYAMRVVTAMTVADCRNES